MIILKPQDEALFADYSRHPIMRDSIREQGEDVARYNFAKNGKVPDAKCATCGLLSNTETNANYFETAGCPFCGSLNVFSTAMAMVNVVPEEVQGSIDGQ